MRAKRWKSTCSARWSGASSLWASWCLTDGEIVIRDGENELRFKQKDVSLCKPLVIITEDDIAMDEEMSDDEKNDSEGR